MSEFLLPFLVGGEKNVDSKDDTRNIYIYFLSCDFRDWSNSK